MTNIWGALSEALLLIESAEYRGQSGIRYKDLIKLVMAAFGFDDEDKARALLKKEGGAVDCRHRFNRKIWGDWTPRVNSALAKAGTDSTKGSSQYPGEPRGGTVMKRNYGGRVVYQPGRKDQSHEQMPSAMDTYDVLMRAEGDVMTRLAYAPSQGNFEERAARLEDLMSGRSSLPLKRRPQPEQPLPCRFPDCTLPDGHRGQHKMNPTAQPVPRVGQNLKKPRDEE